MGCQVVEWWAYSTEAAVQWLLVWLCVTRLTAITWPSRTEALTSMRTTIIAIGAIFTCSALLSMFTFLVYDVDKEPQIAKAFMAASVRKAAFRIPKHSLVHSAGEGFNTTTFLSPSTESFVVCSARDGVEKGMLGLVLAGGTSFVLSTLVLLGLSIALGWRLVRFGRMRDRLIDRKRSQLQKELQEREMRRQSSLPRLRIRLSREARMAVTLLAISVFHLSIHLASAIDFVLMYTGYILNFSLQTMSDLAAVEEVTDALNILIHLWNCYAMVLTIPSFRAAILQFFTCGRLPKELVSQQSSLKEARTSRMSNGQPPPTAPDREALVLHEASANKRSETIDSAAIEKL